MSPRRLTKPTKPQSTPKKPQSKSTKLKPKKTSHRLSLGVKNLNSEQLLRKWTRDKNPKHVKEAKQFFKKLMETKKAPAITTPEFYLRLQHHLLSIVPRERRNKTKAILLKSLPYEIRLLSDREYSEIQRKGYLKQILKKFGKKRTLTKINKALEKLEKAEDILLKLKPKQLAYTYEKKPSHKSSPIQHEFLMAKRTIVANLELMRNIAEFDLLSKKKK